MNGTLSLGKLFEEQGRGSTAFCIVFKRAPLLFDQDGARLNGSISPTLPADGAPARCAGRFARILPTS